jgi:hypothetical protein
LSDPKLIGELEAIIEIAIIRKLKSTREITVAFQDDITDEQLTKALGEASFFEIRCVFG